MYRAAGYASQPRAYADLVLIPELGAGKVTGWSPTAGAQALATGDWQPLHVGVGPSTIAWVGIWGTVDNFNKAQFFSSPLARTPGEMRIKAGPLLPHKTPFSGLVAEGDYAAMEFYDSPRSILVVRISTSEVWQIPRDTETTFSVLGFAAGELIIGHSVNAGSAEFDYLRRYDLSRLSEYATLMPPL